MDGLAGEVLEWCLVGMMVGLVVMMWGFIAMMGIHIYGQWKRTPRG